MSDSSHFLLVVVIGAVLYGLFALMTDCQKSYQSLQFECLTNAKTDAVAILCSTGDR